MDKVQIIILAGGKSKRMLTDDPKALAKLKGKHFLAHILETIENLNLPIKPVIVVGHKKERIFEELGQAHNYAHQAEQLGTGHAVQSSKGSMREAHETVLVLSVDQPHISKETISNLLKTHLEKKPTITIGTVIVPDFEDWRAPMYTNFGRIIRGTDGLVKKIVEFKDASEEEKEIKELNPALYAFDANWLWDNIDKLENKNIQREYYLTDLLELARTQGKVVEAVPVSNILEGLQPNTSEEVKILESLI